MTEPSMLAWWWRVLVARWAPWRRGARLQQALRPSTHVGAGFDRERAERWAARIARSARAVPRSRCLDRSLVLVEALRVAGARAELRLGVRREGGALRAHAWGELEGHALAEDATALAALAPLAAPELPRAVFD